MPLLNQDLNPTSIGGGGGTSDHSLLTNLSLDTHLQYIPVDATRGFTAPVVGVMPVSAAHLATKEYVDGLIAPSTSHSALTDLNSDDHLQYARADGSRGFTGEVSGVYPTLAQSLATKAYVDAAAGGITDHDQLDGLGDDDHTQYIRVDGARAFSVPIGGITPTAGSHLATKDYVDTTVSDAVASALNVVPRRTVSATETLTEDDVFVTVDASSGAVDLTLFASPVDGQSMYIKAIDITNAVTITSVMIDGVLDVYTFGNIGDAIHLIYNASRLSWEIF